MKRKAQTVKRKKTQTEYVSGIQPRIEPDNVPCLGKRSSFGRWKIGGEFGRKSAQRRTRRHEFHELTRIWETQKLQRRKVWHECRRGTSSAEGNCGASGFPRSRGSGHSNSINRNSSRTTFGIESTPFVFRMIFFCSPYQRPFDAAIGNEPDRCYEDENPI